MTISHPSDKLFLLILSTWLIAFIQDFLFSLGLQTKSQINHRYDLNEFTTFIQIV